MSFWKKISTLALVSLSACHLQADSTWTSLSNGTWSNGANWNNGVPNGSGVAANFNELAGGPNLLTVTDDVGSFPTVLTLGSMVFNSTTPSYTIAQNAITNRIRMFSGSSTTPATIQVTSGSHQLFGSVAFNFLYADTNPLNLNVASGATFTINDTVIFTLDGNPVTVTGPGTLALLNGQLGSDTGSIVVNDTTVNINATIPNAVCILGSLGAPGTVTLNNSTLNLVNSAHVGSGAINVIVGGSTTTANSTTINALNTGAISTVSTFAITYGAVNTIFNGGTATFTNDGPISGPKSVGILVAGRQITINGNVNVINNGTITAQQVAGVGITSDPTEDTITVVGGTVNLMNTAPIEGNASISTDLSVGAALGPCLNLVVQGGTIVANNAGSTLGPFDFGTLIGAVNVTQTGGTLINNAIVATNNYNLSSAGIYAGTGVLRASIFSPGPVVFTNGGTVVPGGDGTVGGATGTMTIQGTYTQNSSGKLLINFNNTVSSLLSVTGSANLGGTLQIGERAGTQIDPGQNYTVLQANGGVNGRFNRLEDLRVPYLNPHATYSSNAVQVSFSPTIFPGDDQVFDENGRELPSGKRGGYVNLSRPVFSSVNETFTRLTRQMGNLRSHFAKPSNEKTSASSKQASVAKRDLPSHLVTYHDDEPLSTFIKEDQTLLSILDDENVLEESKKSLLAAAGQEGVTKEKRERLTESLGATQEMPWNFYVGPKAMAGDVKSEGQTQGYKLWSAGAFIGMDYAFSEVGIGLLAEYERMDARVGKKWGKFTIDSIHADAYATYAPSQLPELSFNGIVGGGYEWYDIHRNVNIANPLQFKGTPHGAEFDAFFGTEYAFRNSNFSFMPDSLQIIPEVAVQYMYLHVNDYSEKGHQLFEMRFDKQNVKSLRTNLGFRVNYTWKTTDIDFSPEAHFSWQREYLDKDRTFGVTPVEFPNFGFDVTVSKMGRNTALAGLDLLVTLYGRHGLEAGYDFEYNSQYHTHFMYMSYNVRF